jgi:hypothetical protein
MFVHPDATAVRAAININKRHESVLVVETTLCLWPDAKEYDEDDISALIEAADAFKRKHGFDKVQLISSQSVTLVAGS